MKLELHQVSKHFGPRTVLQNLQLVLSDWQALTLIGPSGGGKSTLLRLLAGLLRPDTGKILLDGVALPENEPDLRKYRSQLSVVFQDHNLFPHLTALANITLPLLHVQRLEPAEAQARADELLARFQLSTHAHLYPHQLSGGQRQRIAIARALALRPKLLLLDEPTSALDPEMTAEVLSLIEQLRAEGTPLVLVTHAMAFARRTADHLLFIGEGTILEHGPATQFFNDPQTPQARRFLDRVLHYG
jgi:polar amino acid transport system ATP-binding protein